MVRKLGVAEKRTHVELFLRTLFREGWQRQDVDRAFKRALAETPALIQAQTEAELQGAFRLVRATLIRLAAESLEKAKAAACELHARRKA